MKKYNTRPIDYTGCHPVIAEHLKRGETIECWVSDSLERPCGGNSPRRFVVRYLAGQKFPYDIAGNVYKFAEPIPLKAKRIMPPERAIPVLIAGGWAFTSTGWLVGPGCILNPQMYALMGGDVDGDASNFAWPSYIIEEVEGDE